MIPRSARQGLRLGTTESKQQSHGLKMQRRVPFSNFSKTEGQAGSRKDNHMFDKGAAQTMQGILMGTAYKLT